MNQIICRVPNFKIQIKCNRARWETVYNSYPLIDKGTINERDLHKQDVFADVFDSYDKKMGVYQGALMANACATRLSIALLDSGFSHIKARKNPFKITNKAHRHYGKFIETGAKNLCDFLLKIYGKADVVIDEYEINNNLTLKINALQAMQTKIKQKFVDVENIHGIYIMLPKDIDSFGATGHATLWHNFISKNGNAIGEKHYLTNNTKIAYFWRLL